jgi:tetratricopeptide (TPR) repeat protein
MYQEAIADYDQAIQIDADFAEAYINRGNSKKSLEQYLDAIDSYTKAIELDATKV